MPERRGNPPEDERKTVPCVLVVTGSRVGAEQAAAVAGLRPLVVLSKADCAGRLGAAAHEARRAGVRTVAIHSTDWSRQPMPQLYELAAARLRPARVCVVEGAGERVLELGRAELTAHVAALPLQMAGGAALTGAAAARLVLARRGECAPSPAEGHLDSVLAIWHGPTDESVGGSVTHIAGILQGFRRNGLRVGLVTMRQPPAQLLDAVDDLEVAAPPSRAARATPEVAAVRAGPAARDAARRLAARLQPSFVYQRYDAFFAPGVELAGQAGLPAVLEWNNSEVWTRAHWHLRHPLKGLFDPLLAAIERDAVRRASLVCAVSSRSAEMALRVGAAAERLIVVPNGVDLKAVDRALAKAAGGDADEAASVGWVGTFGPWHGAEVLVAALADLPPHVRAVMVGDGPEREQCEELAQRLGVADRVEWAGALPHGEAVQCLAACDVLASPHVPLQGQPFFGSPTKLFEYMAIGRPIVASALEQLAEVLDDWTTARLVEPGDPHDLARGIRDVLALPNRGRELGLAARREAEARHSWDLRAQSILDRLSAPRKLSSPVAA